MILFIATKIVCLHTFTTSSSNILDELRFLNLLFCLIVVVTVIEDSGIV